jgi:iron complex transport system substrate-binding protein
VKGNGITMAPTTLFRSFRFPAAVAAALLLAACGAIGGDASAPAESAGVDASATAPAPFPVTLTDARGSDVTLTAPPQRIVSLAPSNTEIVCALGGCDRIVAVTDYDDHPPEVTELPKVVIQTQVDVEAVVAAEPDLVLAAGNELTPTSVIEQLDGLGIAVLTLYPETLEEVTADIVLIGRAIGAGAEAADLVDEIEDRVDAVVAAVDGADRPRTLYEVFHAEGTTYTAGAGSFLASLVELAGGEPVTGDAQGVIGAEDLVAADPELVLLGTASYDPSLADPAAALDAVRQRPGWSDLAAVTDGRVVPYLDDIVTTRPGPRIVDGLEALARAIHPERFD